jgi:hypothetical protein
MCVEQVARHHLILQRLGTDRSLKLIHAALKSALVASRRISVSVIRRAAGYEASFAIPQIADFAFGSNPLYGCGLIASVSICFPTHNLP